MDIQLLLVPYDTARRSCRSGRGPEHFFQAGLATHLLRRGHQVAGPQVIEDDAGQSPAEIRTAFELGRRLATAVVRLSNQRRFFYNILKEAQLREDGLRLGPVEARIVAEVFVGLRQLDPDSYLTVRPNWLPTLPTHDGTPQSFRMIDFMTFAGVEPASRGQ
jgi:hypothetical protein